MRFERFKSQAQNSQQNILSYLFFYITLVYGFSYAFFSSSTAVQGSALAAVAIPPIVWGVMCMLVILSVAFTILFKWRRLAQWTGIAGFCLWIYVFLMSILTGQWFAIVVIIIPMLLFWFFWFMGVNRDNGKQAKDSG